MAQAGLESYVNRMSVKRVCALCHCFLFHINLDSVSVVTSDGRVIVVCIYIAPLYVTLLVLLARMSL